MSDIGQPADTGDSELVDATTQPVESGLSVLSGSSVLSAAPDGPQEPSAAEAASHRAALVAHVKQVGGMDTVDACRMRLVALRTRIEINWPQAGGLLFMRSQGLGREAAADIAALLVALPTPLPLQAGGEPEPIVRETDTDMREVAGRAVDAGLALLEGATLETIYHGDVKMLEDYEPGAPEPIMVSDLTVGVLVSTIIGTLDAISETVVGSSAPGKAAKGKLPEDAGVSTPNAGNRPGYIGQAAPPHPAPPKRGRSVPRI